MPWFFILTFKSKSTDKWFHEQHFIGKMNKRAWLNGTSNKEHRSKAREFRYYNNSIALNGQFNSLYLLIIVNSTKFLCYTIFKNTLKKQRFFIRIQIDPTKKKARTHTALVKLSQQQKNVATRFLLSAKLIFIIGCSKWKSMLMRVDLLLNWMNGGFYFVMFFLYI